MGRVTMGQLHFKNKSCKPMTLDNTTMYMVQTNANGYIVAFENQWMTKAGTENQWINILSDSSSPTTQMMSPFWKR